MENHALEIIDILYTMIAEAFGVPLGNDKCIVDRDKALSLLDDLKTQLPVELSEAKRLVSARDEFVGSAKQEADDIRRMAEEQARQMLDQQNIIREAQRQADEILYNAQQKSDDIRRVASQFLDDALRDTEEAVANALDGVRSARAQFRAVSGTAPEGHSGVSLEDVEDTMDEIDLMS